MMNEIVAKKYANALAKEFDLDTLSSVAELLSALAEALSDTQID